MKAQVVRSQTSFSGDAVLATGYNDDSIVSGKAFLFEKNFTISASGTLTVLWDYTTYTNQPGKLGLVYVRPPNFVTTSGPVTATLYRGTTDYTGGTQIVARNPNITATKSTSGTTITYGATGSVKGTVALEYLVGTANHGNTTGGGTAEGLSFFISGNNRKALLEIVNASGSEITFHYGQLFFEI